jgi:putative toxin-antitoxin system antitoxin component (TIGR02293 family)
MDIPMVRIMGIAGVAKATAERKMARDEPIAGACGHAALAMLRLIGIAEDIVAHSTAAEAKGFDAARWLGHWIERPQPSLGGKKPADLLDTPTGADLVARLLGSIESGAFQ